MDDGRDRHARHVRGLVAAGDVLARPGLSARSRLRRLCDIAHAALDGHRTAVVVTDERGAFRIDHHVGPPLADDDEVFDLARLHAPGVAERLTRREAIVVGGGTQPQGRGVLALSPMTLDGELWGCLCVEGVPDGGQAVDDLTLDTLRGLANMAAHVVLAERLRIDRAEILSRELLTEQRNRRRLSNRLHDGPQQILVSLRMRLQMLQSDAPDELAAELGVLADHVSAARDELRALILDLDTMTGHAVLSNALRSLLETNSTMAAWQSSFHADDGVDDVNEEAQLTIERVVQEALANARQHAEASTVEVRLTRADGLVTVVVADDGVGLPANVSTTGTGHGGIRAMHERIWLVGGTLHIESDPGRGTRVVITAPRHA
ncbi:ATP-binding protein [Acidimicrobiia bacterium EGI L10123]|uniref:sensor histidine kinase n=1 Tax=Salinilacustrithrix flava TaxID=2957203 RepID=UPI003D7C3317|nr:ATP-binding protein [Acidimicrobiia bacterium EGI L10123]